MRSPERGFEWDIVILKPIRSENGSFKYHTPMTHDYSREQTDSLILAFEEWKEAASEWISFYRKIEEEAQPLTLEKEIRLRNLEQRLNEAAEAYEQALQDTS